MIGEKIMRNETLCYDSITTSNSKNICKYGQLTKNEIIDKHDVTIWGMKNNCLKCASYDITPSMIAMSIKTGMLENIYDNSKDGRCYVYIHPKDTVLVVSTEYISVDKNVAGYVTSRVSNVSKGLGHISTTIDPNWNGALLIALSNPTNRAIKINVGYRKNVSSIPLATVTFHYLSSEINTYDKPEYESMRIDLLEDILYKNKTGVKAFFRKIFFKNRKHYTDFFFKELCDTETIDSEDKWVSFIDKFSKVNDKEENSVSKFIIRDTKFNRLKLYIENHKKICFITGVVILVILKKLNIIPDEIVNQVCDFLKDIFL